MSNIRLMRADGFTIIEVMLFLAVSSLLAVMIIGGTSMAINQQRYKDTLNSLQGLIQQQYTETAHVVNGRSTDDDKVACGAGGPVEGLPGSGVRPGMSNCLVMGRSIVFDSNRRDVQLSNIIAYSPGPISGAASDIEALQQYSYSISPIEQQDTEVAWGGELAIYRGNEAAPLANHVYVVILRSPLTGIVRTFAFNKSAAGAPITTGPTGDIKTDNIVDISLCVNREFFSPGEPQGVLIGARAANSSSVEQLTTSGNRCAT